MNAVASLVAAFAPRAAFAPQEVFALPFMRDALVTVVILSIAAGIVGLFISFRELEFVSDGLVHAVFPGLVIGFAVGGGAGVLPGAVIAAVVAAVLFTVLERRGGVGADAAIAVVLTGLFSLGIVLVSRQGGYVSQLEQMLFGHLLTVSQTELWQILVIALVSVALVAVTWRRQLFRSFDSTAFEMAGFSVLGADLVLGLAVAMLVVAGVQALGVLMVIAILTVPMAVARLVSPSFVLLIPIAILVPLITGAGGLWLSFEWSVGSGATISPGAVVVLLLVAAYLVAAVVGGARALVRRSRAKQNRPAAAGTGTGTGPGTGPATGTVTAGRPGEEGCA